MFAPFLKTVFNTAFAFGVLKASTGKASEQFKLLKSACGDFGCSKVSDVGTELSRQRR